jgi:hypothetical protein
MSLDILASDSARRIGPLPAADAEVQLAGAVPVSPRRRSRTALASSCIRNIVCTVAAARVDASPPLWD